MVLLFKYNSKILAKLQEVSSTKSKIIIKDTFEFRQKILIFQ